MKKILSFLLFAVLLVLAAAGGWYYAHSQQQQTAKPVHQAISREGVLTEIKRLNRLESTAFHIDTIIKTEKQGNWYMLWQDAQTGLFMARGQVVAGVDLDKLTVENVQIVGDTVILSLPPVEILNVNLDNIDVYDIKTGSLGLTPIDKTVFQEVQDKAKQQVLESACKAGILGFAQAQAQTQLETLFALAQTKVSVYPSSLPPCKA
ncbi:MAG: DUF4230 domain-containing protein [Neisseria sp.]|uniref:DUF4230 domain-containing protein n=1 Tax=Neisseria sp. TaxID=192066 RepID=UPI0026DD83F5|nr:DUF4230 domain-containing protein [Neisseria sp.]MDO4247625.1 DUF4230 domain-containing protein [Neisseria sp.]